MWSAGSSRGAAADVYLSRREVAVVGADGVLWRREAETLELGLGSLVEHLRTLGSPRAVRVWLGADLCRPVRVVPIPGARTRQERWRVAQSKAVVESRLTPPCRVAVDAGAASGEDLAVVVEESCLAAIEGALGSIRTRAASIRPWWAEALASALRANASLRAFGAWEGSALTTLVGEGRSFSSAQTLYPVESGEAAAAAFARTQVSAMVAPEDALAITLDWASGPEPDARSDGDAAVAVFTPWVRRLGARS